MLRSHFLAVLLLSVAPLAADVTIALPVYVPSNDPQDYTLFANGGWDGNWYVGYDTCWIRKLPPIPEGSYERAYLGARIGRAKVVRTGKGYRDVEPLPASLYMAISSTPAWTKTYPLAESRQLSWDSSPEEALTGVGDSQWFWTEIPLSSIQWKGDNFIALGSSTPGLVQVSSSPVLAAAWGKKSQDTWIARKLQGAPPAKPQSPPGDAISIFDPALVLKLIPKTSPRALKVYLYGWQPATPERPFPLVQAHITGDAVTKVWLELESEKTHSWQSLGRPLYQPPFNLPIPQTKIPLGRARLRVVASNMWEDNAASTAFTIEVGTAAVRQTP